MGVAEVGRAQVLSDKSAEALTVAADRKPKRESEGPTLGNFLASAREGRGVSVDDAVKETRIPNHYVRMIESSDYSLISDQLYVLPFLRRYATFLQLDPEEMAMRFVREVQRADNAPSPRSIEPIEMDRPRNRNWSRLAVVAGLLGIIVVAWIMQAHRRARHAAELSATSLPEERSSASH
jgi:cytoskeletal protein RodZ